MNWRMCLILLGLSGTAGAAAAAPQPGGPGEVRRLQRAALARAGLLPRAYGGLRLRLRLAPLLPQLTVSVWRGLQLGRADLPPLAVGDPDRMSYSVTARWDLSRLLYAHDELQLEAQAQRAAQLGRALGAEVARLYYEHQAALREPGAEAALRAARLRATLEALTGLEAPPASREEPDGAEVLPEAPDE